MRRSATEVLRRGFDVTVANWPLIAIRIVESILLIGLTVGAVLAAIIPIAVSAGLGNFSDVSTVAAALVEHWLVIVYVLIVITILLTLLVAIHSFVDGGTAQILIDSERSGAGSAFNMERWLKGGRSSWWRIFWIYNIVWSIAGIVLLLPLGATLAVMLAVSDSTGRIVIACAGLLLVFLIVLPIGIIAAVWTEKAIAVCLGRNATASDSMRIARQEMGRDFARHFGVAFIVIVVSLGGAAVIGMVSAPMSLLHQQQPILAFVTAPLQIVVSFAQSIFSAATGTWFLASFVAMTEEK